MKELKLRRVNDGVLEALDFANFDICVDCMKGEQTNISKKKSAKRTSSVLEIVHTDMSGPYDMCLNGQICDALKPGGPLTNRQLAENSWISGDPIPHCYVPFTEIHNFNKNRTESPLYGELYPKSNLYKT